MNAAEVERELVVDERPQIVVDREKCHRPRRRSFAHRSLQHPAAADRRPRHRHTHAGVVCDARAVQTGRALVGACSEQSERAASEPMMSSSTARRATGAQWSTAEQFSAAGRLCVAASWVKPSGSLIVALRNK